MRRGRIPLVHNRIRAINKLSPWPASASSVFESMRPPLLRLAFRQGGDKIGRAWFGHSYSRFLARDRLRRDQALAFEFVAVALAGRPIDARAQVGDQPTSGAADLAAALMDDMDAERNGAVFGGLQAFQPTSGDMVGDHMDRHVAPAKAGEEKFEPGRQIGEAPDVMADDAAANGALRQGRAVSQHELHMRLQRFT